MLASGVSSQTLRVCSHWPKKLSTSAVRARGSASMRRTCRSRTPARAACRESPGRAARRPGCCSRGRTTGATRARRRTDDTAVPGAIAVRIGFDPEQEIRADEHPLERRADAAVEVCRRHGRADRSRAASARRRSSPAGDTRAARASTESSSRKRSRRSLMPAGTRRSAGGLASPAAPGRCTARRSAATRWQARRWERRLRGSRSERAPGPALRP